MRGGSRKNAGRKPGSKEESRLIQKHCRFNKAELDKVSEAAEVERKTLSRFLSDAALEKAEAILSVTTK